MRLCVIQIAAVPQEYLGAVLGMIRPSFEKVLRPDTEVAARGPRRGWGGENPQDMDNPYFVLLNEREIIEAIIEAEREGFDAVWVNCFGDPGVRQARHVVKIPVIGPAEATLHCACQIGRRFAVIGANMPGQIEQIRETIRYHGLESRVAHHGVRLDRDPFVEVWAKGMQDPKAAVEGALAVAEGCVADGADVIIIGCCGTGPLCSAAGINKITVDGRDIPVLDPTMIAAKTAEMLADIRGRTGLPMPSRARNFALPSPEDWKRVRAAFGLPA